MSDYLIDLGKYRARATTGADFGVSAKKGTPFVRVAFEVLDEGPYRGELVPWTGYFADTTKARTVESLRTCGCTFPDDDIENLAGITANVVQIVVEHEEYEYEGEQKVAARVAWVNSLVGKVRDTEKMSDEAKSSFRSKMKGLLMATAKPAANGANGAGGGSRPETSSGHAAGTDDDIPF